LRSACPARHRPLQAGQSKHNCCLQVGVLNWFARLWDIDEDEYWGYITNCGTEGNLHGILVGRENLPDGAWSWCIALHEAPVDAVLAACRHPVCVPGEPLLRLQGRTHVPHACRQGALGSAPRRPARTARLPRRCAQGPVVPRALTLLGSHSALEATMRVYAWRRQPSTSSMTVVSPAKCSTVWIGSCRCGNASAT
jgi:hypothetical protein